MWSERDEGLCESSPWSKTSREIKMKSHGVRICGLVEGIEIRLEGQVESGVRWTEARISMDMAGIIGVKYSVDSDITPTQYHRWILGVINEYVKLKPGNGIRQNPIMSWGQLDELKDESMESTACSLQ
ncbi:hypothetical protein EDD18DRAFT_1100767 [Armillaria luteobubalina]|uniref:Uncharacterized protein n=1 Tax=Armillaria luteobubalina TaxID=153913 RepID=A0AA39QG53_9AGAR|nr:hypothetical protein EDD18DRAFT_1100767 [Armillaria luteobubalina]